MCTGGHGRDRQRRRSHYASRYSTSPYTTLAAVPNTITGPATVNILTAVPVTMPSARKSMAGEATALAKPVMGTNSAAGETYYNYAVSQDMGGAEGYQAAWNKLFTDITPADLSAKAKPFPIAPYFNDILESYEKKVAN